MGKGKRPSGGQRPPPGKTPRGGQGDPFASSPFRFTTDECECEGPFGFHVLSMAELLGEVVPKLKAFETMTWAEIQAGGSHAIEVTAIVADASGRLEALGYVDVDAVFSLRLSGKERVFGIKDGAIFRTLWWDAEHRICPSEKKHT